MYESIMKAIHTDFPCETYKMNSNAFKRAYRAEVRKQCKKYGLVLLSTSPSSYCECSGFITDGKGNYAYFNSGDFRYSMDWKNRVLWRGCKDETDYHGYTNHICYLEDLVKNIKNYFLLRY